MTVSTTQSKIVYNGNAATTVWSFNFPAVAASDLEVFYTDASNNTVQLSPSMYSVALNAPISPNPTQIGGTVTYPLSGSPIAIGTKLTIARNLPVEQDTSLANQGTLYQKVIEQALDYVTLLIQQVQSTQDRALLVPITDPPENTTIPGFAERALQFLGFDSAGVPIAASVIAAALVSTAWQPVIAASTLQAGRTIAQIFVEGPVFDTRISAAAANIDDNIKLITTGGYRAAGDRGGSIYYKDTSLSTPASFSTADGKFWTPVGPVGRPEMCGAYGDGAIDGTTGSVSGHNDSQAISDCKDTFSEWSLTEAKIYVVDPTLSAPVDNWCVKIDTSNHKINGNGGTLALANGVFDPTKVIRVVILFTGVNDSITISNITCEHLNVYGNARNQLNVADNEYSGIQCNFIVNPIVTGCRVYECAGDSLNAAHCVGTKFIGNFVDRSGKDNIYLAGGSEASIVGNFCTIPNWGFNAFTPLFGGKGYAGIAIIALGASVVGNNIACGNSGSGINIGTLGLGIDSTIVSVCGNTINGALGNGIAVAGGGPEAFKLCAVSGNSINESGQNGIFIQNVRYVAVDGNTILTSGLFGILLNEGCQDISITGGAIMNSLQDGVSFIGCINCTLDISVNHYNTLTGFSFGDNGTGTGSNTNCHVGDTTAWQGNVLGAINGSSIVGFSTGTTGRMSASDVWDPGTVADNGLASHNVAIVGPSRSARAVAAFSAITVGFVFLSSQVTGTQVTVSALNRTGGNWVPGAGVLTVTVDL